MKNWLNLIIFLLPLYLVKIKIGFVPFDVLELLVWLAFGLWLARKEYRKIEISKYQQFALPALLIVIATILATLFSNNLNVSAGILKSWFLAPGIFGLMVITTMKEQKDAKNALGAFFASSVTVALISLAYFFRGAVTFDGRLAAFYLSPNHLAMYLAPGFLIGFWLGRQREKKTMIRVGLAVLAGALYLTFSYLAWLSVFVAMVFMEIVSLKWKGAGKKVFIALGVLAAVCLAAAVVSQWHSEKLNNLFYSSRSSLESRLMIWKAAWEIGKDNPVFGIGPGMFQDYYLKYQNHFAVPYLEWAVPQPHNLFLAFWLECGLAGLAGFVWLLAVYFKKTFAGIKRRDYLALILFSLMGYMILHGLADTIYFKNDLAMIFWLFVVLAASIQGKEEKA